MRKHGFCKRLKHLDSMIRNHTVTAVVLFRETLDTRKTDPIHLI